MDPLAPSIHPLEGPLVFRLGITVLDLAVVITVSFCMQVLKECLMELKVFENETSKDGDSAGSQEESTAAGSYDIIILLQI